MQTMAGAETTERHENSDAKKGVGSGSGLVFGSGPDLDPGNGSNYLIVRPEKGGFRDLLRYGVWGDEASKLRFLDGPEHGKEGGEADDHRWVIVVSILVRKIIGLFRKPMEYTGFVVDFFLNLLSENGGLFGLLLRLIHAKVVVPQRGSETFISTIGQLDGRIDLYKGQTFVKHLENLASDSVFGDRSVKFGSGSRALLDLCMMASKLAYENVKVVENVVHLHWKMNLVEFLDCWNDYQKEMSTQVFILTDKPKDANLILISFRGTEPFNADDWMTDFDYSCYSQRIWRHPKDQEVMYQNYITEESSTNLLNLIKPILVLSGHDHDQCTVTHKLKNEPVTEHTLGTISWQQGNLYPSFMLLSVRNSASQNTSGIDKVVHVQLCFLPWQTFIYIWYFSLFVLTLLALLFWPKHGISCLSNAIEWTQNVIRSSFHSSGTKEKNEDENCEYEMVWDAEGSMHLVKKVLRAPAKRPSNKPVVERGNAVIRSAARKNTNEEIEIVMDSNANAGSDPPVRLASNTGKSRTKLVIHRVIRTIKMVIVIAALNVPIYMMLLFKDWIEQ